jgi:hypothetical protein
MPALLFCPFYSNPSFVCNCFLGPEATFPKVLAGRQKGNETKIYYDIFLPFLFLLFYRRAFRDKLENQTEREKKGERSLRPTTRPGFDELKTITKDDIYDYLLRLCVRLWKKG